MNPLDSLTKEKIIDLLNRCWMTHDGMWFFHCLKEFGIEKANEMNKAAIRSLAPIEIARINGYNCPKAIFLLDRIKQS